MDTRDRLLHEMAAADAIRSSSEQRIGGLLDTIRSDIYDKLIHQAWFGQYPQQYADDLYRYADQVQDAAMPTVEAPTIEAPVQEASMEAFYGVREQEQEVREPQPPAYEREIGR